MIHLLFEWWLQLWPNVFAISIWTVVLFWYHHAKLKAHIEAFSQDLKTHVSGEHENWAEKLIRHIQGDEDLTSGEVRQKENK